MTLIELITTGYAVPCSVLSDWIAKTADRFNTAFIEQNRYIQYFKGLGVTLEVALFAGIIGIVIGTIMALFKLSTTEDGKPTIWNYIASIYIDVIRGTPSVLQLMIMYFVIMASVDNQILVASLSFGINSGAYVAEIVRGGILAVDKGQSGVQQGIIHLC